MILRNDYRYLKDRAKLMAQYIHNGISVEDAVTATSTIQFQSDENRPKEGSSDEQGSKEEDRPSDDPKE